MSVLATQHWARRIEAAIAGHTTRIKRVIVLAETDSTQDAARRMAEPGDVVVAARQVAGRGRLGRRWLDAAGEGVALTLVLSPWAVERLAVVMAVGVAHAVEELAGQPVGIKWPNDIMVGARKLAGILIERSDGRALVGIGLNVNQTVWPQELDGRAVSLRQMGKGARELDRVPVIAALLNGVDRALGLDDTALVSEFARRDALRGALARFSNPTVCPGQIEGRVQEIDPLQGLGVRLEGTSEMVWLPAATTSVREVVADR